MDSLPRLSLTLLSLTAWLAFAWSAAAQTQEPLFALLSQSTGFSASSIEIVDLQTTPPTQIAVFPLDQPRDVPSMAVSADGARIYLVSRTNNEVVVFTPAGTKVASIAVFDTPNDAVLSLDGRTLYVTTVASILAIDTGSNTVRTRILTGTDILRGVAISRDGSIVGAAVTTGGDTTSRTNPGLYLFNATTLATIARVPITVASGCIPFPKEVAFTETGLGLVWDTYCGRMYQVDVAGRAQLAGATVSVAADGAGFFPNLNGTTYSAVRGLLYAGREDTELEIVDPVSLTKRVANGVFSQAPFVPALTSDDRALFVASVNQFSSSVPATLDRVDTDTEIVTPVVYAFASGLRFARDMRGLAPNTPPYGANATATLLRDPVATCAARVRLDGGATDDDGDTLAYAWTGAFATASGATATVTMSLGPQTATLTASDGKWRGAVSQSTSINVTDMSSPTFTSVPAPKTVRGTKPVKVSFKLPIVTDNCTTSLKVSSVTAVNNGTSLAVTLSSSSVTFMAPPGVTTVTFFAKDGAGNVGSASTTVTVTP